MRRRTRQSPRGRAAAYRQERAERMAAAEVPLSAEQLAPAAGGIPPGARPGGPWAPSYLPPPPHRRRAVISALISALLHLSSVTLFTIVIYLPRREPEFLEFSFVEAPETMAASSGARLRLGNVRVADEEELWEAGASSRLSAPLELPTLEFAEIGRLRMRQLTANPMPREELPGLFSLVDPLGSLEAGLSRLRGGAEEGALSRTRGDASGAAEASVFTPAPGLRAWIEWGGGPGRPLLYAPPIQALRDVALEGPLEFVIQVNSTGRVVNVWTPALDGGALVDAIQLAVLRYRFEPQESEAVSTGTLHIAMAEEGS